MQYAGNYYLFCNKIYRMDNTALIQQCAQGNRDAMELLYDRFGPRLMRVIRRYITDSEAAEDILHDGFIIIFTHIAEVRDASRLEFWMGTVMKNLCLKYLSTLDVMTILDEETEIPDLPDLDEILTYEELDSIINRLPDGYRKVFKLAVLEKKSHKEIGKLLGISAATSASQLFHAKVMLRRLIVEHRHKMGLTIMLLALGAGLTLLFTSRTPKLDISSYPELTEHHDDVAPTKATLLSKATTPMPDPLQTVATSTGGKRCLLADVPAMSDSDTVIAQENAIVNPSNTDSRTPDTTYRYMGTTNYTYAYTELPTKHRSKKDRAWSIGASYNIGGHISQQDYMDMVTSSDASFGSPTDDPGHNKPNIRPIVPFQWSAEHELPLTFVLSAARQLSDRLNIESGLQYTLLRSKIVYHRPGNLIYQNVSSHYIGVPLKLNFRLFSYKKMKMYITAGGAVDFPIGKSAKTTDRSSDYQPYTLPDLKARPQFSVTGGIGIQLSLSKHVGLYVEPSARHCFDNRASMPTYWQEHPTGFSIPVGLRINW